jgi:hypothetical protein
MPQLDPKSADKLLQKNNTFVQTETSKHVSLHIFFKMLPNNSSHQSSLQTNAFLAIIEGAIFSLIILFLCRQFHKSSVQSLQPIPFSNLPFYLMLSEPSLKGRRMAL